MKENIFPGTILRERREMLGHTLQEIQQRTHVPLHCLEGFESGCFDKMPGCAYAVGFLRSYCRFLDLDPEPFVDQYLVCTRPQQTNNPLSFIMKAEPSDELTRPYPRWLNDAIAWGGVCAVILLGWLAYNTLVQPLAESWKSRVEAGGVEINPPVHFNEEL